MGHAIGCALLVGAIIGIASYSGARRPRLGGLVLTVVFIAIPLANIATSYSALKRTAASSLLRANLDSRRQAVIAAFDEKAKITNEEAANLHMDDVLKPKNLVDRAAIANSRRVVIQYRQVRDQAERDAGWFYEEYSRAYDSAPGPEGERIRAQLTAKKKAFLEARGDLSRAVDRVLRIVDAILDLADRNVGRSFVSDNWVWFADSSSAERFRQLIGQLSTARQQELDALAYCQALQQDTLRQSDRQAHGTE